MITAPGIYPEVTEHNYLSDPVDGGSLSSSGAKKLLISPAHYMHDRSNPRTSQAFDFGTAAHRAILGAGSEVLVVDAENWKSKAARDARDAARDAGQTPLLAADWETIAAMTAAVRSNSTAAQILDMPGTRETTIVWHDRCWRRARVDVLTEPRPNQRTIIADYKTTVDADTRSFERAVARYGYHQQAAWYCDGVKAVTGTDTVMVFIAQEKTPPFAVQCFTLDGEALRLGRELNAQAVATFELCRDTGEWPAYPNGVRQIDLPKWAYYQHEEST